MSKDAPVANLEISKGSEQEYRSW